MDEKELLEIDIFAYPFVLAQEVSRNTSSYALVDCDIVYSNLYIDPLTMLPLQPGE